MFICNLEINFIDFYSIMSTFCNVLPVDHVPENSGVYGQQSDKRQYAPLFIRIAYSEFFLRFVTLPIQFRLLMLFFEN